MIVNHESDSWTTEDRDALRTFLSETRAGSKLLSELASRTPALLGSGDTNTILIRMGEVRGAQSLLGDIFSLAHPANDNTQAETDKSYPSLTDDAAWADGQKIESPTK
jgi:hypothetical protein